MHLFHLRMRLLLLILKFLFLFTILDLYHSIVYDIKSDQVIVLVTGASSGIGKSTALEFANDSKFKVYATMRDIAKWEIESKDNLVVKNMDVTSDDSVKALVDHIIAIDGKIDIVINNAGYGLAGCLELASIDEAKALFDVNVWGVVRVIQHVLPYMRKEKSGHLIQISSTSGIRGIPCMEYYTGSKFALEGITDSLRYSLSAYNISVTNLNAGPVKTSFTDRYGHADKGGKGSRQLIHNDTAGDYLYYLNERMIKGLNHRINSDEGQSSQSIGNLIVNLATMRLNSKRVTDIPFNIGSSRDSQALIQEIRKQPTGWGGVYNDIMKTVPHLSEVPKGFLRPHTTSTNQHEEL